MTAVDILHMLTLNSLVGLRAKIDKWSSTCNFCRKLTICPRWTRDLPTTYHPSYFLGNTRERISYWTNKKRTRLDERLQRLNLFAQLDYTFRLNCLVLILMSHSCFGSWFHPVRTLITLQERTCLPLLESWRLFWCAKQFFVIGTELPAAFLLPYYVQN